jgi:hypothetical protein
MIWQVIPAASAEIVNHDYFVSVAQTPSYKLTAEKTTPAGY